MSDRWAARLPMANAAHLNALRLIPKIEVCPELEAVWLRGDDLEAVDVQLRGLPGVERFRYLADGQLVPVEHRVPSCLLPKAAWTPLVQWITCTLPRATWPTQTPQRVALRLERVSLPVEPNLLLLPLRDWQVYVATAPQVRLDRWSFALDRAARALVRGTPLPPLDGVRFVEREGIAVPLGWHWQPAVDAGTLRVLLGLDSNDGERRSGADDLILLTSADCQWERVPEQAFVRATRSAVRLSAEAAHE